MNPDSRILIAGSETLAGQAITLLLREKKFLPIEMQTESLFDFERLCEFFKAEKPEYVFLAAGKSGSILFNQKHPAELMRSNLLAELQVMEAARLHRVKKILFLASSCVYPKNAPQPMSPEHLGSAPLEMTSEAYALSKLTGITLAAAYAKQYGLPSVTAIPADVFGPEDEFNPEHSHVIEGLIRKIYDAKIAGTPEITLWGSGTPVRDFLYSKDLAEACFFLMNHGSDLSGRPVNISAGNFLSIKDLAVKIKEILNYEGRFLWDFSKPDGTPVKTLNADFLRSLGWCPRFSFDKALLETHAAFLQKQKLEVLS